MAGGNQFGSAGHLIRRFFDSLFGSGPAEADAEWLRQRLSDREYELFTRMSKADRKHAVASARTVVRIDGGAAEPVVVAASLHDVGKTQAGLGTFGRVGATVVGLLGGRNVAQALQASRGLGRRVGLYLRHDELGAEILELAGSDELVVAWARDHHRRPEDWTVPAGTGRLLAQAD